MRICMHKKLGLIESQSGGDESQLDVLLKNAVAAGYDEADVEVRVCTDAEFKEILEAQCAAEREANPPKTLLDRVTDECKTDPDKAKQFRSALGL